MDGTATASQVTIEPADQQLVFTHEEHPSPGTTGLAATITIHNKHHDKSLLYRVQTTSPLSYRVRPSHGRIDPSGTASVSIVLAVDSKKSDKFLVKWVAVAPTVEGDFNDVFQVAGKAEEYRLRCVLPEGFQAGSVSAAATSASNSNATTSAPNSAMSSSANLPELAPSPQPESGGENNAAVAVPVPVVAPVPVATKLSEVDELKAKLRDALAKNDSLQKQIDSLRESQVTQRVPNNHGTEEDDVLLNRALVHANQHNVPPVLVALIALFAFLLGLLF